VGHLCHLGDGTILDMNLGYLITCAAFWVPHVRSSYPFVQNALLALGFPDILSSLTMLWLLARLAASNADVVLEYSLSSPRKEVWLISTPRAVSLVVEKLTKAICAIVGALRFGHLFTEFTSVFSGDLLRASRCWRHRDRQVMK